MAALVLLAVVPIRTSPANVAKECGAVVTHPAGQPNAAPAERRGWIVSIAQEQRLEAVCDDAMSARWMYIGWAIGSAGLAAWVSLRPAKSKASMLLLAVAAVGAIAAAVLDGPPLLLGLLALGCLVVVVSRPGGSSTRLAR